MAVFWSNNANLYAGAKPAEPKPFSAEALKQASTELDDLRKMLDGVTFEDIVCAHEAGDTALELILMKAYIRKAYGSFGIGDFLLGKMR